MAKLTIDAAVLLPDAELETRAAAVAERVQGRLARVQNEGRDLTDREHQLTASDRDELSVLRDAIEVRSARREQGEQIEARSRALTDEIGRLTDTGSASRFEAPSLLVSDINLRAHSDALREGRTLGTIETRARVTAAGDLGSAGAWAPGRPNEPRTLISFAGIPVSELTGKTATVPVYTGPTGGAGADETAAHPEYDNIAPASLTALRFGRWTDVSSIGNELDDLSGVNQMHAWGIARDLDLLAVTAIQTAAGTPVALGADLEAQVREAILTVAAATYSDESQLVIVGTPADLALLTGTTPANGNDVGSVSVRFAGARIYPTNAAAAEQVTVFAPGSMRVFQSRLQSASQISPKDGSNVWGSWLHSTPVANQIVGSAEAVATAE